MQQIPRTFYFLLLLTYTVTTVSGNVEDTSEWRIWTSTVGTTLEAKLLKVQHDSVILEGRDGRQLTVKLSQLVEQDRTFVTTIPEEKGSTQIAGLDAIPGVISGPITCKKDNKWSYHLYLSKSFHDGREWPVWFIMSPVGAKYYTHDLQRHIDGAEQLDCILALSIESKNGFDGSGPATEAMINDVFDRLPVTSGLAFTTGSSGGARMAYLIAERDRRIGGVLACGAGSGKRNLRSNTYVYSLIGTNCFNRSGTTISHLRFPNDYRLRFFPGGHEWAGSEYLSQGMARVLGAGLERKRSRDYETMRNEFVRTMLTWAKEQQSKTPWETHYWTDYLKDFPSSSDLQNEARSLESSLSTNPKVKDAIKADRAILKFAEEYFQIYYKVDMHENDERKKDADKLANSYKHLPHGELLRRLGNPCDEP